MAMPENFASYKEKIEAKFTATYLLIKAPALVNLTLSLKCPPFRFRMNIMWVILLV